MSKVLIDWGVTITIFWFNGSIIKEIKADILVLDLELLDIRQKEENLTGTLIADLVL